MQTVQSAKIDRERMNIMERILGVTKAREKFGDLVEQVQYQGDTYIISRNGKPAAAIVPIGVYEKHNMQLKLTHNMSDYKIRTFLQSLKT